MVRLKCGLCEYDFREDSMSLKVSQKAVWDLREKWGLHCEGTSSKYASRMYQGIQICTYCSQFFVYDIDKAFDNIRGNHDKEQMEENRRTQLEKWNGRIVDEGVPTPSMIEFPETVKLPRIVNKFKHMTHTQFFESIHVYKDEEEEFKPQGSYSIHIYVTLFYVPNAYIQI